MKLKTQSFINDLGEKCWFITRGNDNPVVVLPAPTNKSKYIVSEGDPPKTLREIKQDVLEGKHDHFADAQPDAPESPSDAPCGPWNDCVAPQVAGSRTQDGARGLSFINELAHGYLVTESLIKWTAKLVLEKDRKK